MRGYGRVVSWLCVLQAVLAIKVKVAVHSDQEDSKLDDEDARTEAWEHIKKKTYESTIMPFGKRRHAAEEVTAEYEDKPTTEKSHKKTHPTDLIFPLIYRQTHINSMFKFGENWYTWSTETRTDGSKSISYYICFDEPKKCDEVGWEHTDNVPKCAFQIDSVTADDRACINSFGVEPHNAGTCDGADQMKISDLVHACGPRVHSLWRFVRVGRRPNALIKPADVNGLVCDEDDECYVSMEYRIHRDRITFSLHEPSRSQTFKSTLKRDVPAEEERSTTEKNKQRRTKKVEREREEERPRKFRLRNKSKRVEGKGVMKEHNDSGYANRPRIKNKIRQREDLSDDNVSE